MKLCNMFAVSNRGYALVLALIIMMSVAILGSVGMQMIVTTFKDTKRQQNFVAQADNVARAGLTDAVSWFRRQSVIPVRGNGYYAWPDGAFDPRTAKADTEDESVGIVREYDFSVKNPAIKARYEVVRQTNPVSGVPYNNFAVHDITQQRVYNGSVNGEGLVWYIPCIGYIYHRVRDDLPFNQAPNRVIASAKASVEIRMISLETPPCAVAVQDATTLIINAGAEVNGQTAMGCGFVTNSGAGPAVNGTGTLLGVPPSQTITPDSITLDTVFGGISQQELMMLSDLVIASADTLPNTMALVYVNGNVTFNPAKPLVGSGILYVDGNLTITAGSYEGVVFVTGNTTITTGTSEIDVTGCIISRGGLRISGSAVDRARLIYNESSITNARNRLCMYRELKSTYRNYQKIQD